MPHLASLHVNETAMGFYKRIGAISMHEWRVYRVTGQTLDDLAANYQNVDL